MAVDGGRRDHWLESFGWFANDSRFRHIESDQYPRSVEFNAKDRIGFIFRSGRVVARRPTGIQVEGERSAINRGRSSTPLSIEPLQDRVGRSCQQLQIEVTGPMSVAACRLGNAHQLGHPLSSRLAAMAKRDLPKNDQRSQSTLSKIVRRRHATVINEDQPLAEVAIHSALQCHGLLVRNLHAAQVLQSLKQPKFFGSLFIFSSKPNRAAGVKVTLNSSSITRGTFR